MQARYERVHRAYNVLADGFKRWLLDAGQGAASLADIEAQERADAIVAPEGALFRADGRWHVYRVEASRARLCAGTRSDNSTRNLNKHR